MSRRRYSGLSYKITPEVRAVTRDIAAESSTSTMRDDPDSSYFYSARHRSKFARGIAERKASSGIQCIIPFDKPDGFFVVFCDPDDDDEGVKERVSSTEERKMIVTHVSAHFPRERRRSPELPSHFCRSRNSRSAPRVSRARVCSLYRAFPWDLHIVTTRSRASHCAIFALREICRAKEFLGGEAK